MQEYREHKDKIERDKVRAELDKAAKKKAKLTEIDSIETGKTVFGGKVTVSQEDWENVTALAKKEVTSLKQTKKLRKERDEAIQERDALRTQLTAVSSELAAYKKAEKKGDFSPVRSLKIRRLGSVVRKNCPVN